MGKMSEVKKYVKEHKKEVAIGAAVVTSITAVYILIKTTKKLPATPVVDEVVDNIGGLTELYQLPNQSQSWALLHGNTIEGLPADLVEIGRQIASGEYTIGKYGFD